MLTARIYIQISDRRLKLSSPQVPQPFECRPFLALEIRSGKKIVSAVGHEAEVMRGRPDVQVINPFADPGTVIGDFAVASKLLLHAVHAFLPWRWRLQPPVGIVHVERRQDDGLSAVEQRALVELCQTASFRTAAVHEGRPLTMDEVRTFEVRG